MYTGSSNRQQQFDPGLKILFLYGHTPHPQDMENDPNEGLSILDVPLELFNEDKVEPLKPGSERRELPVFMLDVAACPGGVVPLHIFEMRYRQVSVLLRYFIL